MLLQATLNSIEPLPVPKHKEVTPKEVTPKEVTPEEVTPEEVTQKYEEKKEKNKKKIIYCEVCHVKFNTEKLLEEHNDTKKHKNKINNQMVEKNAEKCQIFVCELCHFRCSKESNYKKHIDTIKHKMVTNGNKKMPNDVDENFSCICGNIYKYRPGLTRHKKVCAMVMNGLYQSCDNKNDTTNGNDKKYEIDKNDEIQNNVCSDNKITITSEMFMVLIKNSEEMMKVIKEQQEQIKEQQEQIITIIPKIGNTTNNTNNTTNTNFNLNVFLNEKCKDALNMSDFIDSLKITLEDLLFSKTNGITRGITDVMIKGLKQLDIYRRPIHCTDIKRDIMYIKDEDTWQKDENHDMMKNTIIKIADKERTALQEWAINNPDWIETEKKQIEYLTMMRSICEPIENYNNYERKIIKNLGKEIQIDKKN